MRQFLRLACFILPVAFAGVQPAAALSIMDPFNIPETLDAGSVAAGIDIAYAPGGRHKLDIYVPTDLKPDKPAPVLVFIYGGAWKQGSKSDYMFAGRAFAARGFVTVIPDYRLIADTAYPGFLQDNAEAINWVENNIGAYGGDPKRLFLAGHSAGAYDAVMLGMDRAYLRDAGAKFPVRGIIGLSGPYAVYPFEFPELQAAFGNVDNPQLTQPINLPTDEAPPMFLGQGTSDLIVSPDNTKRMADKFAASDRSLMVKYYEGLGHMDLVFTLSTLWRWRGGVLEDAIAFMESVGAFDPRAFGPVDLVSQNDAAVKAIDAVATDAAKPESFPKP